MKHKLFRLGLTVAMLAVLVESLGAPMKWGWSEPSDRGTWQWRLASITSRRPPRRLRFWCRCSTPAASGA